MGVGAESAEMSARPASPMMVLEINVAVRIEVNQEGAERREEMGLV